MAMAPLFGKRLPAGGKADKVEGGPDQNLPGGSVTLPRLRIARQGTCCFHNLFQEVKARAVFLGRSRGVNNKLGPPPCQGPDRRKCRLVSAVMTGKPDHHKALAHDIARWLASGWLWARRF